MSHSDEPQDDPEGILAEVLAGEREVTARERDALLEALGMGLGEFEELRDISSSLEYQGVRAADPDPLDVDVDATLRDAARRSGGGPPPEASTAGAPAPGAKPSGARRWVLAPLLGAAAGLALFVALREGDAPAPPGPGPRDTLDTSTDPSREAVLDGTQLTLPSSLPDHGRLRVELQRMDSTGADETWETVWKKSISGERSADVDSGVVESLDPAARLRVWVESRGGSGAFRRSFPVQRR